MNIFFLINGNIYNYSLALGSYSWNGGSANAILPWPPGIVLCHHLECEPLFVQSYINAYNTAFNQETPGFTTNYQVALKYYQPFTPNDTNSNFIPGTFGYKEEYENSGNSQQPFFVISYLQDDASVYVGTPYLFVSVGSGAGSGFMYLDWIIVTYGVPYVVSVS